MPLPPPTLILEDQGYVHYYPSAFDLALADAWFTTLLSEIPWQPDEVVMFGKRIVTARKVAWFAENSISYRYSGSVKQALPWSSTLSAIKQRVEQISKEQYNSCLLNLYHHGGEGMGWHADDESSLDPQAGIASISLGAPRNFRFKHKKYPQQHEVLLQHGSLLLMQPPTQQHWLHCLPKTRKTLLPRINLTFRRMLPTK